MISSARLLDMDEDFCDDIIDVLSENGRDNGLFFSDHATIEFNEFPRLNVTTNFQFRRNPNLIEV